MAESNAIVVIHRAVEFNSCVSKKKVYYKNTSLISLYLIKNSVQTKVDLPWVGFYCALFTIHLNWDIKIHS